MAKHFEVKIGDGTVVARSMTLGSTDLAAAQPGSKPVKYDCPLPRDESGRAVLISLELSQKGPPEQRGQDETIRLVVAKETKPIRNDLRTLAWILAGTTAAGASVAATLAWLVVSRALVPVRELSRQIRRIEPSGLGQRVEVARLPSEVQAVAVRLNEMLGRLAIAFERERAFTADAAHELRTPLAGIRSIAEVAVSSPQSVEESGRDFREIVQVTTGMQAMVEKVFGRFWRADPSRTGNSGHWGLGLSLVSRTMSLMGGTAHAQLAEGGLFCLSLCLPTGEIPAVDPCGGA